MTGILPSYQRFVNGVPVPSISRRAFRLREKYLIVSVLLTFAIVWLGALFYLPEFKSSSSVNDSVYNVYKRIQKAGPELLMPPPLAQNEMGEFPVVGMVRHGEDGDDPHVLQDRNRLRAKIEEDMSMKVLERPQFDAAPSVSSSKGPSKAPLGAIEEPIAKAVSKVVSPSDLKVEGSELQYVVPSLKPGTSPDIKEKLETIKGMSRCLGNAADVDFGDNTYKQYYFASQSDDEQIESPYPIKIPPIKRPASESLDEFFEEPTKKKPTIHSSTVGRASSGGMSYVSTNQDDALNATHIIKIEITDLKKISNIPQIEHWKHSDVRVKYYINNKKKCEHEQQTRKLIYDITKEISSSKNCKKFTFKNKE